MNSPWTIELLGQLSVQQAGRQITRFRTQKTGLLLAYLALNSERLHPRDEIIERFWPDEEVQAGRNSLRVALSSLRHQLEPPGFPSGSVLVADRSRIGLNPVAIQTDVAEFQAAHRAAEQARTLPERVQPTSEPARTPSEHELRLCEAVELYRGPLLPGYYDDWVVSERERLAALYLNALRPLVRSLAERRAFEEALRYARLAVAADPVREEFHRSLMRLYLALGRPAEALSQYEDLERLLRAEMDAEPSNSTQELARQIPGFGATKPNPTTITAPPPVREPAQSFPSGAAEQVTAAATAFTPPRVHRLPLQFTRFFGREAEIERLVDLLTRVQVIPLLEAPVKNPAEPIVEIRPPEAGEPGLEHTPTPVKRELSLAHQEVLSTRLVTLTGAGGAGKTRLSIEVAARVQEAFEQRLWFVPLADVDDPRRIIDAILVALDLPPARSGDALDQVVTALLGPPALLVLDNFEQLASGGAPIVLALLKRLPSLTCLVSSRRRLHMPGEVEFPVGPLPVPPIPSTEQQPAGPGSQPPDLASQPQRIDSRASGLPAPPTRPTDGDSHAGGTAYAADPQRLLAIPSVALFVARAQSARPDFQITPRNADEIAALCRRLEGIPLALELAAARAAVLSPAQMLTRLTERFELLATRKGDPGARHGSVWAAIEWSYHLLSRDLQRFFARLSVFRGGWSIETAERVCCEPAALEYLSQLRSHSLILMDEADGEPHFTMLETLREYAARQLDAHELDAVEHLHAECFLDFAERADPAYLDARERQMLDRTEREHGNLLKALQWYRDRADGAEGALRLAGALRYFWIKRGYFRQGRSELEQALSSYSGPTIRCKLQALHGLSGILFFQGGQGPAAMRLAEELLAGADELSDPWFRATGCDLLGSLLMNYREVERAKPLLEAGLEGFRRLNDRWGIALSLDSLANHALICGDLPTGKRLLTESAALFREVGEIWSGAWPVRALGEVALEEQEFQQARIYLQESLEMSLSLRDKEGVAVSRTSLGTVALRQGDLTTARAHFEAGLELLRELGKLGNAAEAAAELARLAFSADDPELTIYRTLECVLLYREVHRPNRAAALLEEFATGLTELDRVLDAARLLGMSRALRLESDLESRDAELAQLNAQQTTLQERYIAAAPGDAQTAQRLFRAAVAQGETASFEPVLRATFGSRPRHRID